MSMRVHRIINYHFFNTCIFVFGDYLLGNTGDFHFLRYLKSNETI